MLWLGLKNRIQRPLYGFKVILQCVLGDVFNKKGKFVFCWWFRGSLWWFEQWVKPAVSNKPVLFIEPMLSMPQPGVGLL